MLKTEGDMFERKLAMAVSFIDCGRVSCPRREGDQDVESCLACPDAVEVTAGVVKCVGWAVKAKESRSRLGRSDSPLYSAAALL
jgi:hypothetical protein